MRDGESSSAGFRRVLHSAVWVGVASGLGMALGMVRGKLIALITGTEGIGTFGIYNTLVPLLTTVFSLGLAQAGVKLAAEDREGPAHGAGTVRWLTRWLAVPATLLTAVLSVGLSWVSFGDFRHVWAMIGLAPAVGAGVLAAGWGAILQGRQQIIPAALLGAAGGLAATILSIPCLYGLGESGISGVIVLSSLCAAAAHGWGMYRWGPPGPALQPSREQVRSLARLGFLLASGIMLTNGTGFLTRILVADVAGKTGAGLYQAAVTLGATLPGFALAAMGASLYPEIVAAPTAPAAHRLVNRQLQVAMLITGPVLVGIHLFAGLWLRLFFSFEFSGAARLVEWIILGTFVRLITWPIGFLLLARSPGRLFVMAEALSNLMLTGATFAFVRIGGLAGSGPAFAAAYVGFTVTLWSLARTRYGFSFDWGSRGVMAGLGMALLAAQGLSWWEPSGWQTRQKLVLVLVVAGACAFRLLNLTGALRREKLPGTAPLGIR